MDDETIESSNEVEGSGGDSADGAGGAGLASGGAGEMGGSASGGASAGGTDGVGGGASGGSEGDDECPHEGDIVYQFNDPESWPSEVVDLLTEAMEEAVYYYNCYADLSQTLTVNYNPGVPTAEANVDGWMSFGSNTGYMQVATAMHEISHTLGVGYYPWSEIMDEGRWTGAAVEDFMQNLPEEQRDPDEYSQRTYITGDGQHFWPYGLNQASEHQSEWSLINHVRIVAAIQVDKQTYLDGQ